MKAGKIIVAMVLVVGLLLAVGGVIWYLSVPHTGEEQFAYAEKLEKTLRGDAVTKGPKELAGAIARTVGEYEKVGIKFGKTGKAAEGLKRAAKIWEEIAKDDAKAMGELDLLIKEKEYAAEGDAGFALMEESRLLRKGAEELKVGKPNEAEAKYKAAIGKLEEYGKRYAKDEKAKLDGALMEIGRIWQDGLEEPLIHSIETFEKVLKDYPKSDYRAEAMFRLAAAYEKAKEYERALALYGQMLEEYPKCEWADKAIFARGKILADKMEKHEEAAKEFEKLKAKYPESEFSGQAGSRAREEEGKAGQEESEKYRKTRYGGTTPYDTTGDKPLPPMGMLRKFMEQRLDAEKYDLQVGFLPAENRITVEGTLKVVNGGADKRELLLQLGEPMKVSKVTVDGKEVKYTHTGETLEIALEGEWKKGTEATVGFAYTGQYAEPMPTIEELKAMRGGKPEGTTTAPATAPGTAPASAPAKKGPKYPYDPQMGLGEFGYGLSGASWYPVTIIGDVFEAHVVIKTPANLEAVTNGEVVRREKSTREGVQGVFEFATKQPVFGLYFAYGPYTVQETRVGSLHVYSYFREENKGKHAAYVDVTNKILSFYASKFGDFPYEKMAMIEAPLPPFLGGVGPASMMFLHEKMVAHKEAPENLLAHELAHQWFGNRVPINMMDEHYNQWLSEGFATYSDALYTEHTDGAKALAMHMQKYGQLFFQYYMMAGRGEGAIRTTYANSPMYRPVVYEKGAIVLHMLRKLMGDDKFFMLMREYVATYKNKPTTLDDFRRLASTIYEQDLSWFFAEWIDQTVFAHWKLRVEMTGGETSGEAVKVKIHVEQPDDLVKMPVDITLLGAGGERQVVANVMLDKKEQIVDVTATFKPVKVILDEEFWVLRHPGSDNIWPAEKATK